MKKPNNEALQHAAEWEALADREPRDTEPSRARAATYRRTAESFRLEAADGKARCVCCLKPFARHSSIA